MRKRSLLMAECAVLIVVLGSGIARAQGNEAKWEVGAQYSLLNRSKIIAGRAFFSAFPELESGVGGRLSYRVDRLLFIEGEINFFPKEDVSTIWGGRGTQFLSGVKVGGRLNGFGLFGKLRAGFMRFGSVFDCPGGSGCHASGRAAPSLDAGGVVEIYPSRRTILRFDAGDTIIRYRDLTRAIPSEPVDIVIGIHSGTRHNFQFGAGVSLRF